MIRLAGPQDGAAVMSAAHGVPVFGAMVEMYWCLKAENHLIPHRFYIMDGGGVLKLDGRNAMLCGHPADDAELAGFLSFMGVRRVSALGWQPPGWARLEQNMVLVRLPAAAPPLEAPPGFEAYPPVRDVLALLKETGGQAVAQENWDELWADANVRRNHRVADILGVRDDGRLAGTTGVWAMTGTQAYIAGVATRPSARGRGYATSLLRLLVHRHAHRTLSLMCGPQNVGFYARLGFDVLEDRAFVCENPAKAKQEH